MEFILQCHNYKFTHLPKKLKNDLFYFIDHYFYTNIRFSQYMKIFKLDYTHICIYTYNDIVVGFILFYILKDDDFNYDKTFIQILDSFISPDLRRNGIFKNFIDYFKNDYILFTTFFKDPIIEKMLKHLNFKKYEKNKTFDNNIHKLLKDIREDINHTHLTKYKFYFF